MAKVKIVRTKRKTTVSRSVIRKAVRRLRDTRDKLKTNHKSKS